MGLFQLINTCWSHSRKNWMGEFNFSQCYLGPLFSFCSFFTKWCCSLVFGCYLLSDFHRQAFMQSFLHKCRFVCGQEHALKPSKHSSPMRSSLCLRAVDAITELRLQLSKCSEIQQIRCMWEVPVKQRDEKKLRLIHKLHFYCQPTWLNIWWKNKIGNIRHKPTIFQFNLTGHLKWMF